jgi:hypothetical protein
MDIIGTILEFWWVFLICIPLYLIYLRVKEGKGFVNFGVPATYLLIFYGFVMLIIYLCQYYLFPGHWFLLFYIAIFLPLFCVFIYLLFTKNNILIIESTMDCEIFYDLGQLDKKISEATRTRAFVIDREAYKDIRHVGAMEYNYWNGGDGVKFTDYFDQKEGVMFHPPVGQLHNVSFFIAKSFWLKMKQDLPELMRTNALLTWLKSYVVAYEQTKLARNFKLRLRNIDRQVEDEPFSLPDDIKKLWEREVEALRRDREASEENRTTEQQAQAEVSQAKEAAAPSGDEK